MNPEETTKFVSVNAVTRIVAESLRNWGSIPSRAIFIFSGSHPAPSFSGSCSPVACVKQLVPASDFLPPFSEKFKDL